MKVLYLFNSLKSFLIFRYIDNFVTNFLYIILKTEYIINIYVI